MTDISMGDAGDSGSEDSGYAEDTAATPFDASDPSGPGEADAPPLEPLPREEVERRWRQTQGALRESRSDLRALKAELAQLRAGISPMEQGPPDAQSDPIGAVQWMQAQFVAAQQREQMAGFVGSIQSQEAEVAAQHPEYHEALEYLRQTRRGELIDLGAPADAVDSIVAQEFMQGVAEAHRQGLNPARVALKLARERGYARRGSFGHIEAGAAAARTLSASGGRGSHEGGSLESRIANLSGQALKDAWRRHKASMR